MGFAEDTAIDRLQLPSMTILEYLLFPLPWLNV